MERYAGVNLTPRGTAGYAVFVEPIQAVHAGEAVVDDRTRVAIDFGTRWERELSRITVSDAVRGLAGGEFPPGSMGPKIESAERFVEAGGSRAVITAAGHVLAAVSGADGTWIVPDDDELVAV